MDGPKSGEKLNGRMPCERENIGRWFWRTKTSVFD